MTLLHPDLRPDDRLVVGSVVTFITLVETIARGDYAEFTLSQLVQQTGLGEGQVRGALHTGWSLGWVRPIQEDPTSKTIDRWTLGDHVPQLAHQFELSLLRAAECLRSRLHRVLSELTPQRGQ